MNQTERHQYRNAIRSFVDLNRFTNPFSVTLTLKQSHVSTEGVFLAHIRIDHDKAVQNFRHFMNLLNTKIYGKAFQRHGTRVQVVPFLEGGTNGTRLHYHCVIDCPRQSLELTFPTLIKECWSKTSYGYDQIDIQTDSDAGWVDYISKFRGKPEYDQSIDWVNFHQN